MNVSPVNNTSFGKLVLSQDKRTRDVLRKAIQEKDTLNYVKESFDKLDKISGNRIAEFSAYDTSNISGNTIYVFCINRDISSSSNLHCISASMKASEKDEGTKKAVDKLVEAYKARLDAFKTKASDSDLNELFDMYSESLSSSLSADGGKGGRENIIL